MRKAQELGRYLNEGFDFPYTPPTMSTQEPVTTRTAFDLLVTGGKTLDGGARSWRNVDVGITEGRVVAVSGSLAGAYAKRTIDASGALVLPGLVDFHTHVYWGATPLGIDPDALAAAAGVTTWVDAGSAGAGNVEGLVKHVIARSAVKVKLFVNVSYIGLLPVGHTALRFGELFDHRLADARACLDEIERFRDHVVGVKVRIGHDSTGPNGMDSLRVARSVADASDLPLMAHVSTPPPLLSDVLPYLRAGDIVTHCYTPGLMGILDRRQQLLPEVREARERGVLFDVGHGAGSFTFAVAEAALAQGFPPDVISSDLHAYNVDGPVFDLTTTMMKFLALGMSLEDVLDRVTAVPSRILGEEPSAVREGGRADLVVARLDPEPVVLGDVSGEIRTHRERFHVIHTIAQGAVLEPNSHGPQGKRKPGLPTLDPRLTRPKAPNR